MKTAQEIAQTFNLRRQGREFRGICPICQANKMELAVWDDAGKLRCKCFYGSCDFQDLFRVLIGLDTSLPNFPRRPDARSQVDKTELIKRLWEETIQPKGSLVEKYLGSRGITCAVPVDLRFHPCLKHKPSGQYFPAMVAAIRDTKGHLQAVHRTFLDLKGQKARVDNPKMSLGPLQGCTIQLEEPTTVLGLAEGIETAMSAMQMSQIPVWCAVNAGNMKEILLPGCVREVVIFADNGSPGQKAATDAAAIFTQDGLKVCIAYPPDPYEDFNDLLMKGGE